MNKNGFFKKISDRFLLIPEDLQHKFWAKVLAEAQPVLSGNTAIPKRSSARLIVERYSVSMTCSSI